MSPNKSSLPASPSYMAEGSPHRHMKSYDEDWVHKPLTRINHLSADSIHFALNLRGDEKPSSIPSPSRMVSQIKKSGKKHAHGTCQLEECAKVLDAAKRLQSKNKYIAKKIAEKEKELILVEKEYAATYAVYEEKMKRTAETNTEMYDLKIFERKKNFPVQIERNRKEQKDLNHEIDIRRKVLLTLKREELKRSLPHGALFSQEAVPTFDFDDDHFFILREKAHDSERDDATQANSQKEGKSSDRIDPHFYHSGTFIRSARTNWDPAWTCCMSMNEVAKGCQCRPAAEAPSYTAFVKSKSEKYIKTVDQWAKSRSQERPGVKEFRQWSSPTLRKSSTLKTFALNRLRKTDHRSNSYTQLVPPKPLY